MPTIYDHFTGRTRNFTTRSARRSGPSSSRYKEFPPPPPPPPPTSPSRATSWPASRCSPPPSPPCPPPPRYPRACFCSPARSCDATRGRTPGHSKQYSKRSRARSERLLYLDLKMRQRVVRHGFHMKEDRLLRARLLLTNPPTSCAALFAIAAARRTPAASPRTLPRAHPRSPRRDG